MKSPSGNDSSPSATPRPTSSSETPASSNASISRTTCTAAGSNSPSSRCGARMPSSSSRRTCSSEHGTSSAICSAEIPATTLTLASLRRPNALDGLAHVEVAALVVRRCAGELRQAPLVQLAPAQRELEPLLVRLDEAPRARCALGVAALGRDRRQPGEAVADEPVQARIPGDAEPLLVRVLGGVLGAPLHERAGGQLRQAPGNALLDADGAIVRKRLLGPPQRPRVVAADAGHQACRSEGPRTDVFVDPVGALEEGFEPALAFHPRRCELDRQRQAVEAAADLGDAAVVAAEIRLHGLRPLPEQLDRRRLRQRRERDLALAGDPKRLALVTSRL